LITRMAASTTQFINQKLLEESPIFSKTRVAFTPTYPLTHLVVANNNIVMAMANKTLIRIDSEHGKQEEIDLTKTISGAKISALFLDPTGTHLLISLKSNDVDVQPELYYLHKKWSKPRPCSKFRGSLVSSVGWNYGPRDNSASSTGPILAGTTLGIIIETELNSDERFFSRDVEEHYKQVFDIGKGQHTPVTGLQYHMVPNTTKYLVMATTPTRLYQFQGYVTNQTERPLLQQVFNNYLNVQERFLELPSKLKYSTLSFYYGSREEKMFPQQFGWLTEPGIYWGRVDPWEGDSDTVTVDCQLIAAGAEKDTPRTAYITQFHALMLFKDRVKGVCLLNEQSVFDDSYDGTYGGLVGLAHDQVKNIYWAFTEYAVYKYQVVNETRHVWRVYLEQGQFNLAMRHCGDQQAAMDLILTKQAEQLFSEGRWVESAMHYAKTKCSFEEVTLKFMDLEEKNALKNYLKKKLETLKWSEKTQITLIVIWLIEIYQNKLGHLRENGDNSEETRAEFRNLEEEFLALLRQQRVEECIKNNKEVVYSLLGSHGDKRSLVYLAQVLRDTERVVQYNLRNKQYQAVLSILTSEADPEMFYSYCPLLLQSLPKETVDTLVLMGKLLSPSRLLPALLVSQSTDPGVASHSTRYLEHAVTVLGCKEQPVHNLLVSLYIHHNKDKVLPYLTSSTQLNCDTKYALKLCVEAGMVREAVYLYTVLGQHDQAVDLALTLDTELAASCAAGNQAGGPLGEELTRKLWLKVAKHVVQEKNDIKQAMEFLKECPSVKIEDILPFFPDFVTIDHFKDAICDSLQQYSEHIHHLKEDMAEASRSAGVIRDEIVAAKADHHHVRASDRCSTCCDLLISRPFYLFSCSHKLHTDCLAEVILPHLPQPRQRKLLELQTQVESLAREKDNASLDSRSAMPSRLEQAQAELDDLIASECVFCGDIMVKNIDKPFIEDQEFDKVMAEWM